MSLSFREKSLLLQLISLSVVFGLYFANALENRGAHIGPVNIGGFVSTVVLLVIIQVVGQAVLGIAHRRDLASSVQSDERDALIRLRAAKFSLYALSVGVFVSLVVGLVVPGNFAIVHTLLASWVVAQIVEILAQFIAYRRGY